MYHWDYERRRFAAMDAQNRLNAEAAEEARRSYQLGDNRRLLLFMLAVIFFKPFAEYCIDLYNTFAGYAQSLGALFAL